MNALEDFIPSAKSEATADLMKMASSCDTLPEEYIDEAVKLMAESFSKGSPSYKYIFQHDEIYRRKALEWLFEKNLKLLYMRHPSALKGVVIDKDSSGESSSVIEEDSEEDSHDRPNGAARGELAACFLWVPSKYVNISTWDMIKAGLWMIPFKFGLDTLMRLLHVIDDMKSGEKEFFHNHAKSLTTGNFIMLERMAVKPTYQGLGLGTKCLKSVLINCDECPVYLMTQEYRNVRFYQRLGFVVVGKSTLIPKENGSHDDRTEESEIVTNWFMTRKPDGAGLLSAT